MYPFIKIILLYHPQLVHTYQLLAAYFLVPALEQSLTHQKSRRRPSAWRVQHVVGLGNKKKSASWVWRRTSVNSAVVPSVSESVDLVSLARLLKLRLSPLVFMQPFISLHRSLSSPPRRPLFEHARKTQARSLIRSTLKQDPADSCESSKKPAIQTQCPQPY